MERTTSSLMMMAQATHSDLTETVKEAMATSMILMMSTALLRREGQLTRLGSRVYTNRSSQVAHLGEVIGDICVGFLLAS